MKCPRCASDMKRTKLKEHQFMYVCPKCKFKIASKVDEEENTGLIDTNQENDK